MAKNVAEVMVDTLQDAGAKRCWGIVGDTINHFTDAIRHSELRWMHMRHEEVGGLAVGAEAFATGELAVCAGTGGPGSLHFVNGIFESHRNGAPVVLVATDVPRAEAGAGFPPVGRPAQGLRAVQRVLRICQSSRPRPGG